MAHISNVDDMLNLITVVLQYTAQLILKQIGPKIADVRVVVDRRAATIDTNLIALEWFELANLSGVGVK